MLPGPIKAIDQQGCNRGWCGEVKNAGGIRSLDMIEAIFAAGETDLIGLCRPFIREPALVNRWKAGDRRKAACISCNLCLTQSGGAELACILEEDEEGDGS